MKESRKCINIAAEMVGSGRNDDVDDVDDVDFFCGRNCDKNTKTKLALHFLSFNCNIIYLSLL